MALSYFASFAVPAESARGLAHSKTLRVVWSSSNNAPASWTAVALPPLFWPFTNSSFKFKPRPAVVVLPLGSAGFHPPQCCDGGHRCPQASSRCSVGVHASTCPRVRHKLKLELQRAHLGTRTELAAGSRHNWPAGKRAATPWRQASLPASQRGFQPRDRFLVVRMPGCSQPNIHNSGDLSFCHLCRMLSVNSPNCATIK